MLCYHGTAADILPVIQVKGLLPKGSNGATQWARKFMPAIGMFKMDDLGDRAQSVYVTLDVGFAEMFASFAATLRHSKAIIITLDIPKSELTIDERFVEDKSDPMYGKGFKHVGPISPDRIVSVQNIAINPMIAAVSHA
jgi:hypothetical protein